MLKVSANNCRKVIPLDVRISNVNDVYLSIVKRFLLKEDFKGPTSLDVNAMFIFNRRFWLGGGWRTGVTVFKREYNRVSGNSLSRRNSFSAITQLYISDRFRVGYSYDHIVSRLSSVQNGSHEITLGLTFGRKEQRLLSPRFF